jgi:hypothetical protein
VEDNRCSCGEPDCGSSGKHPLTAQGVKDASTDPDQIGKWWNNWPSANIALAMGQPSGLLALDIDPRHDGNENLFELEKLNGELPKTLTSFTGGGGSHLLFEYVSGIRNQAGKIAPGIDMKTDGGYIVAPPSMHRSGISYRWADGLRPGEIDPAHLPQRWIDLLIAASGAAVSAPMDLLDAGAIPQGQRNDHLMSLAGSMRKRGLTAEELYPALTAVNDRRCKPPLEQREVWRIAQSAGRYPTGSIVPIRATTEVNGAGFQARQWPDPLDPAAFYGVAGDFVKLVEPHSEADPAALLVQFLVEFGNVIGRSAHFRVESDQHFMNLFAVLVGTTSKGRKGTSEGNVKRVIQAVDSEWAKERVKSGLASGEGLIWQVRDPVESREPVKEKGRVIDYQVVITDDGEKDKRLLIVEPEFARVLQVCEREANTLSAVIRQAWDRGDLNTLTKNNAVKATGAHISIIGHITSDELRRLLTDTAAANGFANRFLWVAVRRSKLLPEGGELSSVDFGPFLRDLAEARVFAAKANRLQRNEESRIIWFQQYRELSEGKPGMLGAVTSRAEAQVMRLACLYAVLDCSEIITASHLHAALALWRYCEDSAAFVFGDALGDSVADEILRALRTRNTGMTRLEIRDHFQRHKSSQEIARALNLLIENGLARFQKEDSGGRPIERWFALTLSRAVSDRSAESSSSNLLDNAQNAHTALNVNATLHELGQINQVRPGGGEHESTKYPD